MKFKVKISKEDASLHLPLNWMVVFTLMLCFSCSSEIFFDSHYKKNEIVVNSLIMPDSIFSCHLSKLVEPLKEEIPVVENAKVEIENAQTGEQVAELFYAGNGWYRALREKPEAGQSYRLMVVIDGHDTITAQTNIPYPAKAEGFDLKFFATPDKTSVYGSPMHTLSFTINDNAGVDNFFHMSFHLLLELYAIIGTTPEDSEYIPLREYENMINSNQAVIDETMQIRLDTLLKFYQTRPFYCTDPVIVVENVIPAMDAPPSLIFSDRSFSDSHKIIYTDIQSDGSGGMGGNNLTMYSGDNLLCFRSLSLELFNYMQSARKQRQASTEQNYNPLIGSFGAQNTEVDVYSNIQNGYGIFGGYSVKNYIIAEEGKEYWWHKYVVQ
ncbi:DUF4249 family protein [Roseimarinus sediminis]|uniref:DUF4249 family protein n=1 Tax=Roseimarinus sediminis TaxID=1610899 RepID=UPI003D20F0B6